MINVNIDMKTNLCRFQRCAMFSKSISTLVDRLAPSFFKKKKHYIWILKKVFFFLSYCPTTLHNIKYFIIAHCRSIQSFTINRHLFENDIYYTYTTINLFKFHFFSILSHRHCHLRRCHAAIRNFSAGEDFPHNHTIRPNISYISMLYLHNLNKQI